MNMKRLLSGMVLACGMVGTVQAADTLVSASIYGGPTQTRVACTVYNAGKIPITFVNTQIDGQFASDVQLNFNDCGRTLVPHAICSFQAAAGNEAFACIVQIAEKKATVRGSMIALNSAAFPLSEADLR